MKEKPNTWAQWSSFMRRFMPVPGRIYKAQIMFVRGSRVAITLWRGKDAPILITGELAYGPEAYEAMPRADVDD